MNRSIIAPVLALALLVVPAGLKLSLASAQVLPTPATTVILRGDRLSVRLVNQTGYPVEYQAIGDTELRQIVPNAEITLRDLQIPISLIFRSQATTDTQERTGLVTTEVRQNAATGALDIVFKPTSDPLNTQSTVIVDESGDVYTY
jgi:hypothetical protein